MTAFPRYHSITDKTNDIAKLLRSRAVARALRDDDAPALIAAAVARIDFVEKHWGHVPALDEWRTLLSAGDVSAIRHVLTSQDQDSTRLRIDSPFNLLGDTNPKLDFTDEDARRRLYRRAKAIAQRDTSDVLKP